MTEAIAGVVEAGAVELALVGVGAVGLFQANGTDAVIEKIRAEVRSHESDISTEAGRKAIASLARKVASSKTRLDDFGKELVAGIKAQASTIDAERKRMRDALDQLRDETRKPLTDWEDAETARVQWHEDGLAVVSRLGNPPFGAPVAFLKEGLAELEVLRIRGWQEFTKRFEDGYGAAVARLTGLITEAEWLEVELAESKRLKESEDQRRRDELGARLQAEAEERAAAIAKREADERVKAAEEKAEKEKKAAAERVRKAKESAAQAKLDADKAVERERERVAEEARKEADAVAKREASKRHVKAVNDAIAYEFMELGSSASLAAKLVLAISRGEVPSVKIAY